MDRWQRFLLPGVWLFAVLGVYVLADELSGKAHHFFGIVGERERMISFQYPVELVQVWVADGHDVAQGELMLEVKRHQLENDLDVLEQEIRSQELKKQEDDSALQSQIISLTAKEQAIAAEMDHKIHALELRLKVNTEMMNSISDKSVATIRPVATTELADLKKQRHFLMQGIQSQLAHLHEQVHALNRPVDSQISELLRRKQELQRQNVDLKVTALFDAHVASVNFKVGELVSPYQSIIQLHNRTPRHIKAYIHEDIANGVQLEQIVWVHPMTLHKRSKPLRGVVESLGNRIVAYPERLMRNPLVPAWGREVIVRLDSPEHDLLFGEKVQVFLEKPLRSFLQLNLFNEANAMGQKAMNHYKAMKITSSHPDISAKKIEASGLTWLSDAAGYLLVSDEQYKKQPGIFVMNEQGVITGHLALGERYKIDDLESISHDGEYFYICSSLSHNKGDELKSRRKQFMRFKYHAGQVTEQYSINLYKVLKKLSKNSPDEALQGFLQTAITEHSLDIESHQVIDNDVYLGFKGPFIKQQNSLIIKLSDVNRLFSEEQVQGEIHHSLPLLDPDTREPMQLADMLRVAGQWFLLSVSGATGNDSVLWHFNPATKRLRMIQQFEDLKAEGLAYQPERSLFMVVFDTGGKKHSKYITHPFNDFP